MKYIIEADSLDELVEALQEITGGEVSGAALAAGAAAAGGEAAPAKRTRKRNAAAAAPDPVQPAAGADAAAGVAAAGFSPTAGAPAAGPGTAGPGAFNPAAAAGGFNPGAGAAVQESAQLVATRNLIDQMAAQHGAANVFNWVKQVLGAAIDQNIPAEQVRDAILPKLSDAQLLDIYQKAGGK